jgi:hypothetical protein
MRLLHAFLKLRGGLNRQRDIVLSIGNEKSHAR